VTAPATAQSIPSVDDDAPPVGRWSSGEIAYRLLEEVLAAAAGGEVPDFDELLSDVQSRPRLPEIIDNTLSLELFDADGDGDLDAFIGNDLGPVELSYMLRNNGHGYFTRDPDGLPDVSFDGAVRGVASGDLDLDGDLDLALAVGWTGFCADNCWNATNHLYLNNGDGTFADASNLMPQASANTHDVVMADFDKDDDLQIYFGDGGTSGCHIHCGSAGQPDDFLDNLVDQGELGFVLSPLPSDEEWVAAVAKSDFNGDGYLDVFLGTQEWVNCTCDAQDRLYLNDGTGTLIDASDWLPSEPTFVIDAAAGDVDGDGDVDIISIEAESTKLLLNRGSHFEPVADAFPPHPTGGPASLALVDVDGDGDLDVAFAILNGSNALFLNKNGVFVRAPHHWRTPDLWSHAIAAGDVDRDGDPDLLVGNFGRNRLYLNNGHGRFYGPILGSAPAGR
jgi:hypothetical protein